MTVIGITGHRPNRFENIEYAQQCCHDVVEYLVHKNDGVAMLSFSLGGALGADTWVAEACIKNRVPYTLYLPFPADVQSKFWSKSEQAFLETQCAYASKVDVYGSSYNVKNYILRDHLIVDNSHYIICFWEGHRNGGTYNTISYANKRGKLILNGLNDLEEVIL